MTPSDAQIEDDAFRWLARRDRGLTPAEQDDYLDWLRADPRHQAALARVSRSWSALDALSDWRPGHSAVPNPDLLALPLGAPPLSNVAGLPAMPRDDEAPENDAAASPAPSAPGTPRTHLLRRPAFLLGSLAAAASIAIGLLLGTRFLSGPGTGNPSAGVHAAPSLVRHEPRRLNLPDGSSVALQGDSTVRVAYSANERRVILEGGEAHFTVAKARRRPFIVEVHGVAVRAVGTAFNVRVAPDAVAVLVTEGQVRLERQRAAASAEDANATASSPAAVATTTAATGVERPGSASLASASAASAAPDAAEPTPEGAADCPPGLADSNGPLLRGGQRAVLSLSAPAAPLKIASASSAELEAAMEWQTLRLTFNDMPLREVALEMNRHNRRQLHIGDAAAGEIRIGGTFRADNVEALIRLLQNGFGVQLQTRGNQTVVYSGSR